MAPRSVSFSKLTQPHPSSTRPVYLTRERADPPSLLFASFRASRGKSLCFEGLGIAGTGWGPSKASIGSTIPCSAWVRERSARWPRL